MLPLTSTTILIADDERPVRMLLRVVLEGAGAHVIEADSGTQGCRVMNLEHSNIDAVVTDLSMPGMDGEGFVREIRERFSHRLPIVVCSAAHRLELQPLVQSGLVQGHVAKPFSPGHLVEVVHDAIVACREGVLLAGAG